MSSADYEYDDEDYYDDEDMIDGDQDSGEPRQLQGERPLISKQTMTWTWTSTSLQARRVKPMR